MHRSIVVFVMVVFVLAVASGVHDLWLKLTHHCVAWHDAVVTECHSAKRYGTCVTETRRICSRYERNAP